MQSNHPSSVTRLDVPINRKPQLLGIQYLRAIAALMVAYLHCRIQIPEYRSYFDSYLLAGLNLGGGVDIFFVISGFIMLISSGNSSPSQFAARRIVRIVPLYWVLTCALAVIALVRPELFRTTVVRTDYVLKSLLFIPFMNQGHQGEVGPLLSPGWSLDIEMFFYIVFGCSLFAPGRFRVLICGLVLVPLVLVRYLGVIDSLPPELAFYTNIRILEFWFGLLIGHLVLNGQLHLQKSTAALIALGGFLVLLGATLLGDWNQPLLQGLLTAVLPASAVVLGVLALEERGILRMHPFLHWLGDASYSVYLSHIFSLGLARYVWSRLGMEREGLSYAAGFATFGMLIVIFGSWITYRFIEKPMLLFLQGRLKRTVKSEVKFS